MLCLLRLYHRFGLQELMRAGVSDLLTHREVRVCFGSRKCRLVSHPDLAL